MAEQTNISRGSTYESFMGHAIDDHSTEKDGTYATTFTNLVDSENGLTNVEHLGTTEQIANNLKKYMHIAMDHYLAKKKFSQVELFKLRDMKDKIDGANSALELFAIIKDTLDLALE